jgi:type I restriction enzyme S subunit
MIAMYGSIGKLGVAGIRCATNQAIAHCVPDASLITIDYLVVMLKSLRDDLLLKGQGIAQQNISQKILKAHPISLPLLAEQRRIIAKVNELMAHCDRLEEARSERETIRNRLAASSLARLNALNPETFQDDARFVLNVLPALTARPDQIKQLRQTVLDLAVRGKLVPQDPGDEPASELLKRISAEKVRLVKAGQIRERKTPTAADPSALPFKTCDGWRAVTIEEILTELQTGPFGSSLHQSDYQIGGVPVVNPASIQNEKIVPIDRMAVGIAVLERLSSFRLREGDIVMARRGEMGRCAVVTEREAGWLCGTGSLILRLPSVIFARFFVLLIGSPYVRDYLGGSAVGATMQNLNQSILVNLVIGLPPLAEQERIVAKVDQLMSLFDQLEVCLIDTAATRRRLLESIVDEALASDVARKKAA